MMISRSLGAANKRGLVDIGASLHVFRAADFLCLIV
jgi:hypothetical protein